MNFHHSNLKVYLNDHLAASVAGIQMAKHCLKNSQDPDVSKFLSAFLTQVTEEQNLLKKIIIYLKDTQTPLKKMAAWIFEKMAHLKLNYLQSNGEVTRLLELEGLLAGVHAKLDMWRMVERLSISNPQFVNYPYKSLIERVEKQLLSLEKFCLKAGEKAFNLDRSTSTL